MVIQKKIFFSPVVCAGITVALLLYSGTITPVNPHAFYSLISPEKITCISGSVTSNPIKTSSGRFYSIFFDTDKVLSHNTASSAQGRVQLLIATEIVEALYPGKLYTKLQSVVGDSFNAPVIEQGAVAVAHVQFLSYGDDSVHAYPLYIVDSITQNGWKNSVSHIRAIFRTEFKRLLYAWGNAGGLLLALLSGSREYTDETVSEAFKNAGLSHVLALSGMHLSLFSGLALGLGKLLGGKKVGLYFSFCAVIVFVWFAGLSPSLFRALLCTLISMVLSACFLPGISTEPQIFFRFITPSFSSIRLIRIISLAFLIHVCLFLPDVFSLAFMLSYGALMGIAIADCTINPILAKILPPYLASAFSASLGAQLCTAPIIFHFFGMLMPVGIIASVIVTPITLGFLIIGIICIVISAFIPGFLYALGDVMQGIYFLLERIVLWFAKFPPIEF
ncbi:MAG: ComEC/Rec2 family competence protein [Spirochaetales bacterium]